MLRQRRWDAANRTEPDEGYQALPNARTLVGLAGTLGKYGNDSSVQPSINEDGRFVACELFADNLVSGDANGDTDAFLHRRY